MRSVNTVKDKHTKEILLDIKNEAVNIFGYEVKEIILYGSYARGEQDNESDIDVIFLVDQDDEKLRKYRDAIVNVSVELSLKHDIDISLHAKNTDFFYKYSEVVPFYKNILKDGVEIYEQ